ncbi:hypothetical protein [Mycobacteroides abscessus]|uniref:hypothetical protein n=1 Tax=Mycobacteroides abscessus TaxID=36809 RepID=UPI0005E396C7|nr:hypothetical protein [Mycobacteroides abscessus]CPW94808.1 Uncharacterised protein [Mycobacteroides abscessus]
MSSSSHVPSAIANYIADAVENLTAAHGAEIAREVEGHLLFTLTLTDLDTDVYMLPGVAKLIESMEDYAA